MVGLICVKVADASRLAPTEEIADGAAVGAARVRVPDVGGEELDEAPGGAVAGAGDERRAPGRDPLGQSDGWTESASSRPYGGWRLQ